MNSKKTKTLIFTKQKHAIRHSFKLNGKELEQVETYTYSGFDLFRTGTFKFAEKAMAEKANRAMFKLRNLLQTCGISPKISMKLFDQLIKPICQYG